MTQLAFDIPKKNNYWTIESYIAERERIFAMGILTSKQKFEQLATDLRFRWVINTFKPVEKDNFTIQLILGDKGFDDEQLKERGAIFNSVDPNDVWQMAIDFIKDTHRDK